MPSASTTFSLACPRDYVLARDVCSYGYFMLAPNAWDPQTGSLWRVLTLTGGVAPADRTAAKGAPGKASQAQPQAVLVHVSQPLAAKAAARRKLQLRSASLRVQCFPKVSASQRVEICAQLTRMLRLDESAELIADFHRKVPRFQQGGHGRLVRSPTLFEDILKTVTSCNVQWPGTISMNRKLCEVLGPKLHPSIKLPRGTIVRGFPTAKQVASARPQTLRARCRVGYRDARIVELGRLFCTPVAKGGVDLAAIENPATSDEDLWKLLIALPGVGPYAAANIMQLLGRYHRLPLDSESVRHGRTVLGLKGSSARVMKAVKAHFAPCGEHAFRSYWFELRQHYEAKHGPAQTWNVGTMGRVLTLAMKKR